MRFALLLLTLLLTALPTARAQDAAAWGMVMQVAAPAVDPVWDSLVAYYPLDGTATDSTGNYTGTVTGATSSTNVPFAAAGTSYNFDASGDYITTTLAPNINPSATAYSMAAWIKTDSSANTLRLFLATAIGSNQRCYFSYDGTSEQLLYNTSDGSAADDLYSASGVSVLTWHHAAVVFDGSGDMLMYLNGVLENTLIGIDSYTTTGDLTIGALPGGSAGFFGQIDEVGIWNRATTSNEIYRIYSEQLTYP